MPFWISHFSVIPESTIFGAGRRGYLAALIIGSMVFYGGLARILGAARWSDIRALLRRDAEEAGDA